MSRAYNFSAGPATLPVDVLTQAQEELVDFNGIGMSIMEVSHRGKDFMAIHAEAQANIRELMNIPDDYSVLFLQGGASSQFAMIPMNLLGAGQTADYTNSGTWASKAIKEAKKIGQVNIAADCGKEIPTRVPSEEELSLSPNAAYLHITSNETISGAQWKTFPKSEAPLIADMSSDIMSKELDVSQFGMIYAGAQKNLGPSGVTLVIIRNDLAERGPETLPTMLQYRTHIANDSMFNTPPCYSIYMLALVTRWLKKNGGIAAMSKVNTRKAEKLYSAIDSSSFYSGTAVPACRSEMNVTFRLPSEELEVEFIKQAGTLNMSGLKGHRSVGGVRASIYNAFPEAGVDVLIDFMKGFEAKNG